MSTADSISIVVPKAVIADIIMQRLNACGITPDVPMFDIPAFATRPRPAIGEAALGGIYAGLTIQDNTAHALILLPGEFSGNWKDALAWADKQGGVLPSRFDALTIFKNLKGEFKPEYYWTSEPYASHESYAWMQGFRNGNQHWDLKDGRYRARAVRRLAI